MTTSKLKRWLLVLAVSLTVSRGGQAQTNGVLILYDSGVNTPDAQFGWIGQLHAKLLANLMGHFNLPCQIQPVENYQAGELLPFRATFYFGSIYKESNDSASLYYDLLPAAFTNDVLLTTNPICWFRYNLWQLSGSNPAFDARFGINFVDLDASGYSNIVYKGESFLKNQLDPELGLVAILNTNLASAPIMAWKTNAGNTATGTPYVVHASNFWYVADSPFNYISEEDRYVAFADILHDILGSNHPPSHRAIIRIEDVTVSEYTPQEITQVANLLHSNNVPFALATIPVYTDPLGYYNNGTPETHRISDTNDADSTAFRTALHYAVSNGAQIIVHGYTHQYSNTNNPYCGTTGDDYEFWRETFSDPTNYLVNLYRPVPEDSVAWVSNRLNAATNELHRAGLSWVAWETPHYAASALDCQVMATNFSLFMERSLYFADDYNPLTTNNNHYDGQFFPYVINKDIYGRKIVPENLGNFEPVPWADYPARLPADIIRAAKKNLVVRDGWANAYFHGFYPLTNLQAMITGIRALGYTYIPLSPASPAASLTKGAATNSLALSFATQFGFSYHVEYKDALTNSAWLEWTNTAGNGAPLTVNLTKAAAQRFFRLRVE